jgi:hypothetical protein
LISLAVNDAKISRDALFCRRGRPCCALKFASGFGHAVGLPLAGRAVKNLGGSGFMEN